MRKKDELSNKVSCMQRAHQEEMGFVLLSRDAAAPAAIRAWVQERIRLGKNVLGDPQITEAVECADIIDREFRIWAGGISGLVRDLKPVHERVRRYGSPNPSLAVLYDQIDRLTRRIEEVALEVARLRDDT